MTSGAEAILDEYLAELEAELASLSVSERAEILLEVREHFEEAVRELRRPTESDLRNILERLGPASEIAAEARSRPAVQPVARAVPAEPPELGLLEVAAVASWVIWWPVGILLAALSRRWSARDKAIAVLVELVVVAVAGGYFVTPTYGRPFLWMAVGALLFPPTLLGFGGAAYLAWKLLEPRPRRWSPGWRIAGRVAAILLGGWLLWTLAVRPLILFVLKSAR